MEDLSHSINSAANGVGHFHQKVISDQLYGTTTPKVLPWIHGKMTLHQLQWILSSGPLYHNRDYLWIVTACSLVL